MIFFNDTRDILYHKLVNFVYSVLSSSEIYEFVINFSYDADNGELKVCQYLSGTRQIFEKVINLKESSIEDLLLFIESFKNIVK